MFTRLATILALLALAACKPPPTDADMLREVEMENFASAPLPSPDTEGAVWASSTRKMLRLVYGVPGAPALMALECSPHENERRRQLSIARLSPADDNATALLALIGNGHISRINVSAINLSGPSRWEGAASAYDERWEPLRGPRQITATVPGAGMVTLNPSEMPRRLIDLCREGEDWTPESVEKALKSEDTNEQD